MPRRLLLPLLAACLAILPRALAVAGPSDPTPEQADLQAAVAAEMAVGIQIKAGGDAGKAIEHLDLTFAALEAKYPRSAAVRDEHASFLWLAQRNQDAFVKWQEADKLDGSNADVCYHLGACWLESGQTLRGMTYFERAVTLAPRDASLHFALGTELYLFRHELVNTGEPETAVIDRSLAELRKASDLEPLDADYAKGYADTFYSIPVSKWPEAIKAWQHFYDISTDKDLAAINLARVSIQMKNKAAARAYLDKVNGPTFQALKKKLMAQAGGIGD